MTRTATFLLLTLATAGAAGCVNNDADSGLRILRNLAPGEACTLDPSNSTFISNGIIDAQSFVGYLFTPEVSNDLVLIEGESNVQKTIFIEGAEVDILFYDDDLFPAASFDADLRSFTVPISGSIEPGGGTAAFHFEIVPVELLQAMSTTLGEQPAEFRTTLDVQVKMFGTKGGGRIESNVFRYPVQVCLGCMVVNLGPCSALDDSYVPLTGGPCNPVQDGVLECCDGTNGVVCPAQPPAGA